MHLCRTGVQSIIIVYAIDSVHDSHVARTSLCLVKKQACKNEPNIRTSLAAKLLIELKSPKIMSLMQAEDLVKLYYNLKIQLYFGCELSSCIGKGFQMENTGLTKLNEKSSGSPTI